MYDKVKILLNFASKISKEREPEKLIPLLTDLAKDILVVDRCSLFLFDEGKGTLYTLVAHGKVRIEVEAHKGIVGEVFMSGKTLLVKDAYSHPKFNPQVDKETGYRTYNILAAPLIDSRGRVMGVFEAINKLDGSFTAEDMELLNLLSAFAAGSVEAQILYARIKEAYEETVMRLSHAAEYKDPETYNHILRVGLISSFLAKRLGFDDTYCYNLKLAATMHDIGKIGIPDNILLKKGRLDQEEW